MIWRMWGGLFGHGLAKLFELAFVARATDQEQRALAIARELDADEVGRRADGRRARIRAAERRGSGRT